MTAQSPVRAGKLIVHATNVHLGGGKSLLWSILHALAGSTATCYLLDNRMTLPERISESPAMHRVSPSIWQRLNAERWLALNATAEDTVLCFGSLPPLFKLRARTLVLVQNRYLIDAVELGGFPLRVRLRLSIERLWLSARMSHADGFVVQTPTMKRLLETRTAGRFPVRVLPFIAEPSSYSRRGGRQSSSADRKHDFVYVASGEPHKNHRCLLEAWCLMAEDGLFPSLCLTLDVQRFPSLCEMIETSKQQHGIRVSNVGELAHRDVLALYRKAGAAVYPSTFESFGLPLLEARQAGLPVLASEMDYVRDVIDPEQSFDPGSPISIARAVKRFMGTEELALPLLDAENFLERLLDRSEWIS